MKSNVELILLEESELVGVYSYIKGGELNSESNSEFENFLLTYNQLYPEDIGTILYRIDTIKRSGCIERYFRPEGKRSDRVMGLPSYFDTSKLRLYCIIISDNALILGSGGVKSTRTYNEDPNLNRCVTELQQIDKIIKKRQHNNKIDISGREISGNLTMQI